MLKKLRSTKGKDGSCQCEKCGRVLTRDEVQFWGECPNCNTALPISSAQHGDGARSGGHSDREYHGGLGPRGEW